MFFFSLAFVSFRNGRNTTSMQSRTDANENSSKNIYSRNVGVSRPAYDYARACANAFAVYMHYRLLVNRASEGLMSPGVHEVSNRVTAWDAKLHSGNSFGSVLDCSHRESIGIPAIFRKIAVCLAIFFRRNVYHT